MFTSLIDLFFPHICAGCDVILSYGEVTICTRCRHEIPLTGHHLNPENDAFKKFYGKVPVEHAMTFMYYHKKGIVQEMIHKLKYKGQEEIGTAIGNWYALDLLSAMGNSQIDAIIPVPLHKKRLKQRGYNQVTAFGKAISDNLGVPFDESILVRKIYSRTQTKKNLLGRILEQESIFDVNYNQTHHDKHFLLIDDVLTTGATLEACCRAILQIPHAKVSIACMAMSHS